MKKKIINLREEGKTYKEISEKLGCSKSLIAYYLNSTTKNKTIQKTKERRNEHPFIQKCGNFKQKKFNSKSRDFQRRLRKGRTAKVNSKFTFKDIIEKFGETPKCYLTGRNINLQDPTSYNFDHILPSSKGGDNSLQNLGLTCKDANKAKGDLTLGDFIQLCQEVVMKFGILKESSPLT